MLINLNNKSWLKPVCMTGLILLSACAGNASQLSAQVTQQGKNLEVSGTATLPDKALILVALLDPAKPEEMNHNVIVQEFAQVGTGTFKTTLKPNQPVPAGKYKLRLRFSPDSYDPSKGVVLQAVGPKGEHLSGPQVVEDGNVKMLISTQEIDYKP